MPQEHSNWSISYYLFKKWQKSISTKVPQKFSKSHFFSKENLFRATISNKSQSTTFVTFFHHDSVQFAS